MVSELNNDQPVDPTVDTELSESALDDVTGGAMVVNALFIGQPTQHG
jgi:hypothetical protein